MFFVALLAITFYIAGIPVTLGTLGETYDRSDRIQAAVLGLMSWLTIVLFITFTFAFIAWCRLHNLGSRLNKRLDAITADL